MADAEGRDVAACHRKGHALRSEVQIDKEHPPEVAELIKAVRRIITDKLSAQSCYAKLAALAHPDEASQATKMRDYGRQYARELGKESKRGPKDWMIELAVTHCVDDALRPTVLHELGVLASRARAVALTSGNGAIPGQRRAATDIEEQTVTQLLAENEQLRSRLTESMDECARLKRVTDDLTKIIRDLAQGRAPGRAPVGI